MSDVNSSMQEAFPGSMSDVNASMHQAYPGSMSDVNVPSIPMKYE